MKLEQLKSGKQCVKLRNGDVYVVLHDEEEGDLFLLAPGKHNALCNYNQNLTHRSCTGLDIVLVAITTNSALFDIEVNDRDIVWKEDTLVGIQTEIDSLVGLVDRRNAITAKYEKEIDALKLKFQNASVVLDSKLSE